MFTLPERFRTRTAAALSAVALLAIGGGIGAAAMRAATPVVAMAPGKPVSIASLAGLTQPLLGERIVTVSGKVAETYGNRFVLADASGRALVETGRGGSAMASGGQALTVQGHYEDGVLYARFILGADGTVTALRGGHGRHHRGRFDDDRRHDARGAQAEPVAGPLAPAPVPSASPTPG